MPRPRGRPRKTNGNGGISTAQKKTPTKDADSSQSLIQSASRPGSSSGSGSGGILRYFRPVSGSQGSASSSLSQGSLSQGSLSQASLSKASLSQASLSKASLSQGSLSKASRASTVTPPPKVMQPPPSQSAQLSKVAASPLRLIRIQSSIHAPVLASSIGSTSIGGSTSTLSLMRKRSVVHSSDDEDLTPIPRHATTTATTTTTTTTTLDDDDDDARPMTPSRLVAVEIPVYSSQKKKRFPTSSVIGVTLGAAGKTSSLRSVSDSGGVRKMPPLGGVDAVRPAKKSRSLDNSSDDDDLDMRYGKSISKSSNEHDVDMRHGKSRDKHDVYMRHGKSSDDDDDDDVEMLPRLMRAGVKKPMAVLDLSGDEDELPDITVGSRKQNDVSGVLGNRKQNDVSGVLGSRKQNDVADVTINRKQTTVSGVIASRKQTAVAELKQSTSVKLFSPRRTRSHSTSKNVSPSDTPADEVSSTDDDDDDDDMPTLKKFMPLNALKKKPQVTSEFSLANLMKEAAQKKQTKTDWESVSSALAGTRHGGESSTVAAATSASSHSKNTGKSRGLNESEDEDELAEWSWEKLQAKLDAGEEGGAGGSVTREGYLFQTPPVFRASLKQHDTSLMDVDDGQNMGNVPRFNAKDSTDTFVQLFSASSTEDRLTQLRTGAIKLWINHHANMKDNFSLLDWLWEVVMMGEEPVVTRLAGSALDHYFGSENQRGGDAWAVSWELWGGVLEYWLVDGRRFVEDDFQLDACIVATGTAGSQSVESTPAESDSSCFANLLSCIQILLVSLQNRREYYAALPESVRFKWMDTFVLLGLAQELAGLHLLARRCFSELLFVSTEPAGKEGEHDAAFGQCRLVYFGHLRRKLGDYWTRVRLLEWFQLAPDDSRKHLSNSLAWTYLHECIVTDGNVSATDSAHTSPATKSVLSSAKVDYTQPTAEPVNFHAIQKLLESRSDLVPVNQTDYRQFYFHMHHLFVILNTMLDNFIQDYRDTDEKKKELKILKAVILTVRKWEQRIHDARAAHMDRTACKELMTRGCFQLHNRIKTLNQELKLGIKAGNTVTGYDDQSEDEDGARQRGRVRRRGDSVNKYSSVRNRPTVAQLLMGESDDDLDNL